MKETPTKRGRPYEGLDRGRITIRLSDTELAKIDLFRRKYNEKNPSKPANTSESVRLLIRLALDRTAL